VIVGSGPQSTNCIPIPERENSTTADEVTCQGKVIISHYLVDEWAISGRYLSMHLELKIKITFTVSGWVVGHRNQSDALCELRMHFECFDGLGGLASILG
jgi:hypothetical protein